MPDTKEKDGAANGKITKAEYEKLQQDSAELQKLRAESADADSVKKENERLKAALAEQEKRDAENRRSGFKAKLLAEARKEIARLNQSRLNGKLLPDTLELIARESVDQIPAGDLDRKYIADEVDGLGAAVNAVKAIAFKAMESKMRELEMYSARERVSEMRYDTRTAKTPQFDTPNFNTLDKDHNDVGQIGEQVYMSDQARQNSGHDAATQIKLALLTKALGKSVVKPGTNQTYLAEHDAMVSPVVKLQQQYSRNDGIADGDFLAHGGKIFHALSEQQEKIERKFFRVAESNEMTVANVIGSSNLAIDFSALVVQATWPRLLAKRIAARTGIMTKASKQIWEIAAPRSMTDPLDKSVHWFGAVDSDTPSTFDTSKTLADGTVVADAGAISTVASNEVPQEIWGYLGEVVDADATITLTVTLPSGSSSTATATFLTTDPVGTTRRFSAAGLVGDVYIDATAVSSTGWTDAAAKGEVAFFAKKPMAEITAGSAADKSGFKIATTTVTATSYNKQSSLTLELIEDLRASLNDEGLDGVATILRLLSNDVMNIIDKQLFYSIMTNAYSGNQTTFAANTPAAGYSDLGWKARLHFYHNDMMTRVLYHSGQKPNNVVWSEWDWASYMEWLTQSNLIHRLHVDANDPFAEGKAKFQISGADVYTSENLPPEYIAMTGSELYGAHSYDYVPLKLFVADNPDAGFQKEVLVRTRGFHGVPDDDKIQGGQSVGLVKVTRR